MPTVDDAALNVPQIAEIHRRRDELAAEANTILERSAAGFADGDEARVDAIHTELEELRAREERVTRLVRAVASGVGMERPVAGVPGLVTRRDPWTDDGRPMLTRAREALDQAHRDGLVPDAGAERVQSMLHADDDPDLARRWLVAASDPAYARAFAQVLSDPASGAATFDDEERAAWRRVRLLQRALGVSADGGFMVPMTLDPAVNLTSAGSASPLRQRARVVTIAGDSWHGVSSAGVTAHWYAEHAEVSDDTPTLADPTIPVHRGSAFVPFSFEWGMDAANGLQELRGLLTDAADQLQAQAYARGTGTDQPTGLVTALVAAARTTPAGTADALTDNDVTGLQTTVGPRFQAGASWLANLEVINILGAMETTSGAKRFPGLDATPPTLLRKPIDELSFLDSPGDTAAAGNDNVLVYGDLRRGMVIVDRVGTSIELVPHLFGANRRPSGQRGALMWFRTGSDLVVPEALRLLRA